MLKKKQNFIHLGGGVYKVPSLRQWAYMLCWFPHDVCTQFDFGTVEPLCEVDTELSKLFMPVLIRIFYFFSKNSAEARTVLFRLVFQPGTDWFGYRLPGSKKNNNEQPVWEEQKCVTRMISVAIFTDAISILWMSPWEADRKRRDRNN